MGRIEWAIAVVVFGATLIAGSLLMGSELVIHTEPYDSQITGQTYPGRDTLTESGAVFVTGLGSVLAGSAIALIAVIRRRPAGR